MSVTQKIYIIAGPDGAGKTTASYTFLPEILGCKEFINADEIAKGLSPFNTESVAFRAGRLMLERIKDLIAKGEIFSFETTLSTKSYYALIKKAKCSGYRVSLLFFYLNSKEMAIERVKNRVSEGGHNIPKKVIERRFDNGLRNLINRYIPIVDSWVLLDNSNEDFELIAKGSGNNVYIRNPDKWAEVKTEVSD